MEDNEIVTVEELTQAIMRSPNNRGPNNEYLPEEEAYEIAMHVLNFFGYSDRIIDNVLEPEDRDTFYMLEDATILTTEREETTLYDGREWRIHYWLFRKDGIRHLMEDSDSDDVDGMENEIYRDIPADAWDRGNTE